MTRISHTSDGEFSPHDAVLITGAAGRLGRLLQRAAMRDGTGALDINFRSRARHAGPAGAPEAAHPAPARCDTLVALWGRTSGSAGELAANVSLVAKGHALARACGARRLLHLSSAAVYGPGRALAETAPLCPGSDYARSKRAMERAVARLPGDDGIAHCCLRLANVVGADSLAPGLRAGAPVTLDRFDDGTGPLRSYIAASDLLRVLRALAQMPPRRLPGVLNVAAPAPVAMAALVAAAGQEIIWRPAPAQAVREVSLDTARLRRLLPELTLLNRAEDLIADWQDLEAMP